MPDADELLRAGDLEGARAVLVDQVKRAPADQPARLFLLQLQCLACEWDRAQAQLRTLASLSPEAQMLAVTYNLAIEAERERAEVFAGRAPPALLVKSSPWAGDLAAALGADARGHSAEAAAKRESAFEAAPDTPGTLNGKAFDYLADGDARFGPAFEAIIAGRWGLVPFDAVERIESEGPRDLRDLVWLPATVAFKTGQSVNAMLPVRYPGVETAADGAIRLARRTEWLDAAWGAQGVGQHEWSLSDGEDVGLLALRNLTLS
ncbi:MAG TPA: type VI secretion system accessory protein TagJ [Caulobacteraceae bacterium]|jgi:type VI secretion system protein ImpE|nr:type VI secretion system accessory protein TagJ [Caulobacteraceae bacterium]